MTTVHCRNGTLDSPPPLKLELVNCAAVHTRKIAKQVSPCDNESSRKTWGGWYACYTWGRRGRGSCTREASYTLSITATSPDRSPLYFAGAQESCHSSQSSLLRAWKLQRTWWIGRTTIRHGCAPWISRTIGQLGL